MTWRGALTFIVSAGLASCSPEPRSVTFFASHLGVAREIVANCRAGTSRGGECENAQAGLASAARDARMREFRKAF